MSYLFEHTMFGFCWLDIIALVILLAVVIVCAVKYQNIKKKRREMEDQLSDLYAEDSVGGEKAAKI